MKKVLLIVIDAFSSRIVEPAIAAGKLPTLSKLVERGGGHRECISIFPTITPAATASLVTGAYPRTHRIEGAHWYDPETDQMAYYGDDIWPVLTNGIENYFREFQWRMNHERLGHPTLYEIVEAARGPSACLNFLWFKGPVEHQVDVPWLLSLVPGVPSNGRIFGPTWCALGDFVSTTLPGDAGKLHGPGGVWKRYGFHDETTAAQLEQLLAVDPLPALTVAYFPNNDFDSHEEGPAQALATIEAVDSALEQAFQARGGLDRLLEECAILITGDHSQCDLDEGLQTEIALDQLLSGYEIAETGRPWHDDEDLMICPNMRAASIYVRAGHQVSRHPIADQLLACPQVDQVMWMDTDSGGPRYHVHTADRGELTYRADPGRSDAAQDGVGNHWEWSGQLSAVDASLDGNRICYGEYPNALERVAMSFTNGGSRLWITARPGYEFCLSDTSTHRRGSHGSLHRLDSISPLMAAGFPEDIKLPRRLRSVDVAGLCLRALEIEAAELVSPV